MVGQFRRIATEKRAEFDPRAFLKPAMAALTDLCALRFEEFGTAGQASRLRPLPLKVMAARYAKGELDPVIGGLQQTLAA
jgi:fructose-bisphosphate aldolase class II